MTFRPYGLEELMNQDQKKPKKRWAVSVYLGRSTYNRLDELAKGLGVPLPSLCRMLLSLGQQLGDRLERLNDGK